MSNCLITGGTRGIGYATALVVAAAGYDVTAVGRTHDGLRSEDLITQIEALGQRCVVLQGDVPSAIKPPEGCHFHPRCPRAEARCRVEAPVLRAIAPDRQVACHLAD